MGRSYLIDQRKCIRLALNTCLLLVGLPCHQGVVESLCDTSHLPADRLPDRGCVVSLLTLLIL